MCIRKFTYLIPVVAVLMVGCGDNNNTNNNNQSQGYDYGPILTGTTDGVILPTYQTLDTNAAALWTAVQTFQSNPTEANLQAAKDAWVAAREPWEQSEAFLFGPVADYGLDPALDSWPVDRAQLDEVLASNLELTADTITEHLGGGLKGFHTVEYLLWGANHTKSASELAGASREVEYLAAATEALANDANLLYTAWAPTGEGFGDGFKASGFDGGRYYSQRDAMQQLVNGMVDICDEVANGKIADPFDEQDVTLVESQFSWNSIEDFADNIRSVQNIYEGLGGASISDFVNELDSTLDARVISEIQAAIDAIYAISDDVATDPFRDAVTDPAKATRIEAAQAAIRTVMDTMAGDVMALVLAN